MQKVSDGTLTTNRAKSTTVAFDPSGNVCTRFLYNATTPADVAVYNAYGRAINDVSFSLGTSFSYPASSAYSIGFGAQFGYYTESNTKLASSDNGDCGLLLCTFRYYDLIGYDGDIVSNLFEGILCRATESDLDAAMRSNSLSAGLGIVVAASGSTLAVAYRDGNRPELTFTVTMEALATELSLTLGSALLVRYDDRIGHRSSLHFVGGRLQASFQVADEIWVQLDAEGAPLTQGSRFHADELDPQEEYETIHNAIQLGLDAFGDGDWSAIRRLMTSSLA